MTARWRIGFDIGGTFTDFILLDTYALFLQVPEPLVPRRRRLEVPERIDRDGNVVTPLDLEAVQAAARQLVAAGAEAIAVCFLHAYRNSAHERAAGEAIRALFPD